MMQQQQKLKQQQLAAEAAQLVLGGSSDGLNTGALGDMDPQVVDQIIQVRGLQDCCCDW